MTHPNTSKQRPLWRSLEEKNASQPLGKPEEKPDPRLVDPAHIFGRRKFVQGSSIAALAAGLQGCIRRPDDLILPYSKAPEDLVPGVASRFATVTARGRDALGLVVTSHEGRPTKVEGNRAHGMSLGATDVAAQASVWNLYDPDRSQSVAQGDGNALRDADAAAFDAALKAIADQHAKDGGAGLRLLTPLHNSPSLRRLQAEVGTRFPQAKFYSYSPIDDHNARSGARIALGAPYAVLPNHTAAKVIVALDADFLGAEEGAVRAGRLFGPTRKPRDPNDRSFSRLYVVESEHSLTGSMADHRLRMPVGQIESYARALAAELANQGEGQLQGIDGTAEGIPTQWLREVASDLRRYKGRSLIVVGRAQPAHVHALAHLMNAALGNFGATVNFGPAVDVNDPGSVANISALAADLKSASTLFVLGGNPVYDAPADLKFGELLKRKGLTSVHLGTHRDETAQACSWHVPMAHELEAWGDQAAADGSVAIQQPLIAPLYGGRSALELIAALLGTGDTRGHYIVRTTFKAGAATFPAQAWRNALRLGIASGAAQVAAPTVDVNAVLAALKAAPTGEVAGPGKLHVKFVPDPALRAGASANNLWALELPAPMTKLVWDNAALISRGTRDHFGLRNGQMVKLSAGGRSIELPVWTLPGHADHSVTLLLGWGRTEAGRYGNGKGFDVNPLRSSDAFEVNTQVQLEPLASEYRLVQTQQHDRMEGRPIAIDATLDEYKKEPDFASYRTVEFVNTPPLWKEVDYSEGHKWGMSIDLGACSGCNACVIACQSENNIPSVGKREVDRGREMSWIRIDRYFMGDDDDNPDVALQPVACQQCEEAPCENVCPVNATTHSPEGLNDMAYNRCIGTRYCANNCPYKVRRFNYLDWHTHLDNRWKMYGGFPESRKLQFNPNVTVRMRGVMEKCTYCVQRIQSAKIDARRDGRKMADGDIVTACQQVCPTGAITFGDLNDENAQVTRLSARDRRYKLLAEVGTQPRTTYLARIRNPNPRMGDA